jgi:hypothetical protein
MDTHHTTPHHLAASGGRMLGHIVAIVLGLILAFAGIALGVTLVLLPVGIPLGLLGLMLILWGATAPPAAPTV